MGTVQVTLASLCRMNQRGLLSRSGALAVRRLMLVKEDRSLDCVMVVDVERSRKMSDFGGKNQVDF